jgi:hypothetical protein
VAFHQRGIPVVLIVTSEFEGLARALASHHGIPDLPMVVVPHPFNTLTHERVTTIATERAEEVIAGIVRDSAQQGAR